MRIAIDALGINKPGGGRTSIINLLDEVFKQDTNNDYIVYLTDSEPAFDQYSDHVKQKIIPISNRFLVRLVLQFVLFFEQRKYDLIHYTKNLGVFGVSTPYILTIHDLTTVLHPELVPKVDYLYWKSLERLTVGKAKHVIAVSNNAAGDISRIYNVRKEKIQVIYHGYSQIFKRVDQDDIVKARQKYQLPDQYFLHVGRIDKKKNLALLVEAFYKFSQEENFSGQLVLVGQEYKKSPDNKLYEVINMLKIKDKVLFTGFIPDEDLPAIYGGAIACVFPSIHEGFGLFALEAMACGTPLIVNKAGALEEIVGDAGMVMPECNLENLVNSIRELYVNEDLRNRMREQGLSRAQKFSWKQAASQLINLYEACGALS